MRAGLMLQTLPKQEIRYHLEMCRPEELRPAPPVSEDVTLQRLDHPNAELRRWLYEEVGHNWGWRDRAYWTDEEWDQHALRLDVEIWILWLHHEPVGFFELEEEDSGSVRITHFGIRPSFMGRGIGGHLLTLALQKAWAMGANRVWLHTSSFDHPHALANYQARGLQLFKTEVLYLSPTGS
jgi:GNAT superfamily N-acetyltransferase